MSGRIASHQQGCTPAWVRTPYTHAPAASFHFIVTTNASTTAAAAVVIILRHDRLVFSAAAAAIDKQQVGAAAAALRWFKSPPPFLLMIVNVLFVSDGVFRGGRAVKTANKRSLVSPFQREDEMVIVGMFSVGAGRPIVERKRKKASVRNPKIRFPPCKNRTKVYCVPRETWI
jgi:hypothetical protein